MANWFKQTWQQLAHNASGKKPSRRIQLNLSDKHEPFGSLSVDAIKMALEEEDFAQLQSLFFYMNRDLKIASSVLARKLPLLGLDFTIESDNEAFVRWATENVDVSTLINHLSSSIYYGVAVLDVGLTVTDGKLVPDFELISPRFIHAQVGEKLKTTADHLYIKQGDQKRFISQFDGDKLIFHKHPVDMGVITDFSLASKLVWYFSLKHLAMAHHMQYFDSVATPPLVAKSNGDEDALVDALYQLKSAGVGVFGSDDEVAFLNISSKADFLQFIEYIDRQIATTVLGNTLSTGEGNRGSYSQSQTHENRQKEVLAFDGKLIATTISDYLNRLEALNFAQPKGVSFSFNLKEQRDLKELSEVVKNLSDSGYELDPDDVENQLGFKIIGKKEPPKNKLAEASTSNNSIKAPSPETLPCGCISNNGSGQNKPYDILDTKQPDTRAMEQALLSQIETLLTDANSFDDAYEALLDAYPNFAIDELEANLFKAVANSALLAEAQSN